MKIVIAEDDLVTREILKRILSHMADEILEANDGIEALELVENHDPDFLFTDLQMPTLDGVAVVEAVRASKNHSQLPIVCLSTVREREEISKLIALGISDYILKPIRPSDVHGRFLRVITQNAGWRQRQGNEGVTSLMIVDADQNFRQFVVPLLEGDHAVTEAVSGSHALRKYQEAECKPTTILVSEGLPLVSEVQLVTLITRLARERRHEVPQFWLVTDDDNVPVTKSCHFTGVVRRSFVPETFVEELQRTVLRNGTPLERLRRYLQGDGRSSMVTATRQTLGVLSGMEATAIDGTSLSVENGVRGRIMLTNDSVCLETVIASARGDAERLAAKVLRRDATLETGAGDVFSELSNTIGGRARAAMLQHDFDLSISLPDLDTSFTMDASEAWDLREWFETSDGDKFFVGLRLSSRENCAGSGGALAMLHGAMTSPPAAAASVEDALL